MSEISDTLLMQRLRNRLMESLELFSDPECVETLGTDESIEIWYDSVCEEKLKFYSEPVFTREELEQVQILHKHIESTYENIPATWSNRDIAFCEPWAQLVMLANKGFQVFLKRDFMDEENEIT